MLKTAAGRVRMTWADREYQRGKVHERVVCWVAWHLPRALVKWAYIRVASHATTGCYGDTVVPELGMTEALRRWDTPNPPARS